MKFLSIIYISFLQLLISQPDPRFDPFDWVLYRDIISVNSISEGPVYTYLGSSGGGVLRYNNYGLVFEEPITSAQGLKSNSVYAVHLDRETGILWAATKHGLSYSYNNMNEWEHISFNDLGLKRGSDIIQIGSSRDYLWCRTEWLYIKCDHSSGIFLGQMISPDENAIRWSSSRLSHWDNVTDQLSDLTFFGNWNYFGAGLIGPSGEEVDIQTYFKGNYSDTWLGTSDRTIFHSDGQSNTLYPVEYGLNNNDVQFIEFAINLWVGGREKGMNAGITSLSPWRGVYEHFDFDLNINMEPQSIYCALKIENEIWFGGDGRVLIYNTDEGFWRTLNELDGVPRGKVNSIAFDSDNVWLGASRGISRISWKTKRHLPLEFEHLYSERTVNAIEFFNGKIWIASNYHLRIYDLLSDSLNEMNDVLEPAGNDLDYSTIRYFSSFSKSGNEIYIGTTQGVIAVNDSNAVWKLAVNQSVYGGRFLKAIQSGGGFIWLLTNRTLIRSGLEDNFIQKYKYDFMGTLNDLYINGNLIWLGTSEGLLKFNWHRDL